MRNVDFLFLLFIPERPKAVVETSWERDGGLPKISSHWKPELIDEGIDIRVHAWHQ